MAIFKVEGKRNINEACKAMIQSVAYYYNCAIISQVNRASILLLIFYIFYYF